MAVKRAATPVVKPSPVRKPALAKAAINRKTPARGDKMVCKICGLGVVVDEVSGLAVFEALICCGKPMRQAHGELVKAGMERARQQGKRIGRPRVSERPEFSQRFAAVAERIGLGELSRRHAAKELAIGYTTLSRLLDNRPQPLESANESSRLQAYTAKL